MKAPEAPALVAAVVLTLQTQWAVEWLAGFQRQFRLMNLEWMSQTGPPPWLQAAVEFLLSGRSGY
jgi:hypothetical protein